MEDFEAAKHLSRSTILDGEISAVQSELRVLSKRQMQMDTMRAVERSSRRPRPTLSREFLVCRRPSAPLKTDTGLLSSSSLLHPRFTRVQEAQVRRHLYARGGRE